MPKYAALVEFDFPFPSQSKETIERAIKYLLSAGTLHVRAIDDLDELPEELTLRDKSSLLNAASITVLSAGLLPEPRKQTCSELSK